MEKQKTSTGLDQNIAGLLAYVLGFITGIIFLILEKDNKFVRFHAMQSTIIFLVLLVIGMIPFFGPVLSFIVSPIAFILWIVLMYKAYQGEMFKLPVIGDYAAKWVNK
jgi:uncharacterized membrane protein